MRRTRKKQPDNKWLIVAGAAALVVALAIPLGGSDFNPFAPKPDRPVLRLLARLAKMGLWVMFAAEQPPQPIEQQYAHARRHYPEGAQVCHQEGW